MRYFSMFTGIGGFELGIKQAYELSEIHIKPENCSDSESQSSQHIERPFCVGFSEIDKYASQLLSIKWPTVKNYGDATKINETELPDFDLLVGGFPCQSFSIAGKRKGFDDTRGTLFFDIARILAYKKPRNVLLENVKGLLSHDGGRTFQTIIGVLTDLGYFVEWQVLNSKNFGVPQNRERVFIVGHLGGVPTRKVFPVGQDDNPLTTKGGKQSSDAVVSRTLTATDAKMHLDGNYIQQINSPTHSNDRVYGEEGISPTLNTMQGGRRQPKLMAYSSSQRKDHVEHRIKEGEANCLTTGKGCAGGMKSMSFVDEGIRIRRLTPLECERLQGFPDNWTQGFSDTQRYKMCGNAVTVNVVQYVITKLSGLQPKRK